jgi:hypothetical protein
MSPDWLDTGLGALRLALLFVAALFFPLIVQLGLLFVASWGLRRLVARTSSILASLLSLVGVAIHEFSHALAALITLAGIRAIKPLSEGPDPGFVEIVRPNFLSRILFSLAPLFGGLATLWLVATFVLAGFDVPVIEATQLDLQGAASAGTLLTATLDFVGRFLEAVFASLFNLEWSNWRTYAGLYLAFSIGTQIMPSVQDLKIFVGALPLALLAVLGIFVWLYVSGDVEAQFLALQEALLPSLLAFSRSISYAFVLTMLGLVFFFPFGFWGWIRSSPPSA